MIAGVLYLPSKLKAKKTDIQNLKDIFNTSAPSIVFYTFLRELIEELIYIHFKLTLTCNVIKKSQIFRAMDFLEKILVKIYL